MDPTTSEAAGGRLAAQLRSFLQLLSVASHEDTPLQRTLRYMRETRAAGLGTLLVMGNGLADYALAKDAEEGRLPLRAFLGGYSSLVAHIMLVNKTDAARQALILAISVVEKVEREATTDVKVLLDRGARSVTRWTRFLVAYALLTQVFVILSLATSMDSAISRLLEQHLGTPLRLVAVAPIALAVMCCHNCLYTLLLLQMSLHHACVAMYRQLALHLKARRGAAHTAQVLEMYGRVTAACRLLSSVYGRLLPHYHTVGLLLPMVSTAEVILFEGRTDMFAIAMVPLIFIFFVPQCLAGQRLEDSSQAVGWGAYQGPWLAEDAPSRRVRLLALLSTVRPVTFGVPGMVVLNHKSCHKALRVWFQYLQILLNTSKAARASRAVLQ